MCVRERERVLSGKPFLMTSHMWWEAGLFTGGGVEKRWVELNLNDIYEYKGQDFLWLVAQFLLHCPGSGEGIHEVTATCADKQLSPLPLKKSS